MSIKGYLITGAVATVLAGSAAWTAQGWRYDEKLAIGQRNHATVLAQLAHATVESVEAARALEQRRTAVVENERDNAIQQSDSLSADMAVGRAVSDRLRRELSELRVRRSSSNTAATDRGAGEQGTDTIGLLSELYARMDEAGRAVTGYADQLRVAGLTCERSYDGVRAER